MYHVAAFIFSLTFCIFNLTYSLSASSVIFLKNIREFLIGVFPHWRLFVFSYMVMPFVAQDLSHIMKKKRLSDSIVTYLFYQLMRGLKVSRSLYGNPVKEFILFWLNLLRWIKWRLDGRRRWSVSFYSPDLYKTIVPLCWFGNTHVLIEIKQLTVDG